jgi:predicted nucleic acid-binding protein
MTGKVILDTGPLIAYLNRRDHLHEWASEQFNRFSPPILSCEPVLTEACYLLRDLPDALQKVMVFVRQGLIEIPFRVQEEVDRVAVLMKRYSDLPMSLADACLVRLSEQYADCSVLTADRHFGVYRRNGRQVIPTILPPKK